MGPGSAKAAAPPWAQGRRLARTWLGSVLTCAALVVVLVLSSSASWWRALPPGPIPAAVGRMSRHPLREQAETAAMVIAPTKPKLLWRIPLSPTTPVATSAMTPTRPIEQAGIVASGRQGVGGVGDRQRSDSGKQAVRGVADSQRNAMADDRTTSRRICLALSRGSSGMGGVSNTIGLVCDAFLFFGFVAVSVFPLFPPRLVLPVTTNMYDLVAC